MNRRDKGKRDSKLIISSKQSHHPNNFLVILANDTGTVRRCFVNARDKMHALRLAIIHYCRRFPEIDISRARIGGIYPNEKKTITKRIG